MIRVDESGTLLAGQVIACSLLAWNAATHFRQVRQTPILHRHWCSAWETAADAVDANDNGRGLQTLREM